MRITLRALIVIVGLVAAVLAGSGVATAGPRAAPNFGVQNPQGLEHCWHPDPVKCFTTGWASGDEVHIVADPIEVVGTTQESGVVTFWCQSIVGFKYQIWVADLEPQAVYTVTTTGSFATTLGTFRTDPKGYGTLNGLLQLPPGDYYLILEVRDTSGTLLLDTASDGQGFGVFGH